MFMKDRRLKIENWRFSGLRLASPENDNGCADEGGFTLMELLIAVTIFVTIAVLSMVVFLNISLTIRKLRLVEVTYTEANYLIERLTDEITQNTIDYEQYWNRVGQPPGGINDYDDNYGDYRDLFFHPGHLPDGLPDLPGTLFFCDGDPDNRVREGDPGLDSDCVPIVSTADRNTFQNPHDGDELEANAVCNDVSGCNETVSAFMQDELYLINSAGDMRTILGLENKPAGSEKSLAILQLDGLDTDGDTEVDGWECAADFDCGNLDLNNADLTSELSNRMFEPISPNTLNIEEIRFFIAPIEDPFKATAETSLAVQQHPHVTILLKVRASAEEAGNLFQGEDLPSLILQTTVSSGVFTTPLTE